jgi:hypothetical protein
MNKHLVWVGMGVLIVIGIAAAALLLFSGKKTPVTTPTPVSTFPTVGTGGTPNNPAVGGSIELATNDGKTVTASDFLHNGAVGKDPNNPTLSYLVGSIGYCLGDGTCPAGEAGKGFVITYDSKDQLFNISIEQEPMGANRIAAETVLLRRLGVSKETMCRLKYYLSVPEYVNERYAGPNLGFSFCPGATVLP